MALSHFATMTYLLISAAVLAGCQAAPRQASGPSLVSFEVTDLGDGGHGPTVTPRNGAVLDFPIPFNIQVRAVASDPAGVRELETHTLSYTPQCDNFSIPKEYRTKVIVLPAGVTAEPATATRQSYRLPLSTATLVELDICPDPAPTSFHIDAAAQGASGSWSSGSLEIRVGYSPRTPHPGS